MKRKIYNVDPTPNPDECKKLIDSYNETCKNYNDKVKEYKNDVKNNVKDCKENIIKWEAEKKKLKKEIIDIQKEFDAAALKFADGMPKTQKFKDMINMGVRFYQGEFNRRVENVYGVGMNLNDKNQKENANCYINYTYTINKNGTKNYKLPIPAGSKVLNSANAAKAIAVLVDLRQRNGPLIKPNMTKEQRDAGKRQQNTNRFLSEPELQKLGFVNDLVVDVKRTPDRTNFIVDSVTGNPIVARREHNGKISDLVDENGDYIISAGGFKLIREFADIFINENDGFDIEGNPRLIEKLKSIPDKNEEIKRLDASIAECNSYIKNELKNGIPINFRRKDEKKEIERFIEDFKKALDNKMTAIKKAGCTAPTKCVEPTLIR